MKIIRLSHQIVITQARTFVNTEYYNPRTTMVILSRSSYDVNGLARNQRRININKINPKWQLKHETQ